MNRRINVRYINGNLVFLNEAEDTKVSDLANAMEDSFKMLRAEFKASEDEIKADIEQADIPVNEDVGVITVVGILLAAPKLLELFAKGLSKLVNVYKKYFKKDTANTPEDQVSIAKNIIEFSHKWHKTYIKGIKWILQMSGAFDKAGIKGDANQTKAAEMLFYVIIAGLAVYSGVQAFSAFKSAAVTAASGDLALGSLEAAMAAVKSNEIRQFLTKIAIK